MTVVDLRSTVRRRAGQAPAIARGYLALRGVDHGAFPEVRGHLYVLNRGTVRIGYRLRANAWPVPSKLQVGEGGELQVGDHAYLNFGIDVFASRRIVIGDNVRIAPFVSIVDDPMHDVAPDHPRAPAPIVIGDNVWLGHRATVLPGVRIGDHAVIGAGSVVTHDIEDRVVAVGVPCRPIHTLQVPAHWRRR
jgi:acetyltransferase-like isoleucine patch superfamily enzyme